MILTKKYALALIRKGKAERVHTPLAQITTARKLDKLYAVLQRPDRHGGWRTDHYLA